MKTNASAQSVAKIRVIMVCGILVAILGLDFYLGAFLAARIGQTTGCQTDAPTVPNVSLSDLTAATR